MFQIAVTQADSCTESANQDGCHSARWVIDSPLPVSLCFGVLQSFRMRFEHHLLAALCLSLLACQFDRTGLNRFVPCNEDSECSGGVCVEGVCARQAYVGSDLDTGIDTQRRDLNNPDIDASDVSDSATDSTDLDPDTLLDSTEDLAADETTTDVQEDVPDDVAEDSNSDLEVADLADTADSADSSDFADLGDASDSLEETDGTDMAGDSDAADDADSPLVICDAEALGCTEDDDLLVCSNDGTAWLSNGTCDYACLDGLCQDNVCGDGYHEPLQSETCDDGNSLACDGCESCSALANGVFTTATQTSSSVVWAPGTGDFTIEGWVEVTGDGTLFGIGDVDVTDSVKAEIVDGVLRVAIDLGSSGFTVGGSSDLRGTGWHHLAVERFATWGGAVFVDGHMEGLAHQEIGSSNLEGDTRLWIGAESTHTAAPGRIDEVRFSSGARYRTGFTPSRRYGIDGSTVALFHFDEGTGQTGVDATGNGRDLTFSNLGWAADDCYGSADEAASCGDDLQAPWESCDSDEASCVGCAVVPDCSGVFGPTGSCYTFHSEDDWGDARATCRGYGGDLITFDDEMENDWLAFLVGFNDESWIGLNDRGTEGNYVWSNGSTASFRNWNGGEPNNLFGEDCSVVFPSGGGKGRWNDVDCSRSRHFICER